MRTWIVTARTSANKFIDQREIKSNSQERAQSDALDWIKSKGGDPLLSTIAEAA